MPCTLSLGANMNSGQSLAHSFRREMRTYKREIGNLAQSYSRDIGSIGIVVGKREQQPPWFALAVASAKAALPTIQLFFLGVLCNVLVCLAVWMSFGAQSSADKVMVIVPPIAAFVAAGFEHSVANLYFLPYALAIKTWGGPEFWAAINQTAASYPEL